MEKTYQRKVWEEEFGEEYLKRNVFSPEELDLFYFSRYGYTRGQMNEYFLEKFDKNIRILEIGTNVGNQLLYLQSQGFTNLYGIEIQERAIMYSKLRSDNLNIIKGDALDIPFKDNYFDLVFTSGVLIHISPKRIKEVLREIVRVTNNYIWGFEYYSKDYEEIVYRNKRNLLWKADFSKLYLKNFKKLVLKHEKKFFYIEEDSLIDQMFLLKKIK